MREPRFALTLLILGVLLGGAALAEEVKPETKISGRVFADFSSRDYELGGVKTDDSGFGIDIKRFYFGIAHIFDAHWSASFVGDVGDKGNTAGCKPTTITAAQVDEDGTVRNHTITVPCSVTGGDNKRYDVFAKNAYIQYKFSDAAMLRVGAASNPWIGLAEEMYGLRYIEQTLIDRDRVKFGDSADWGVHFLGKTAGGMVNYALSAINGLGYSDPKRTKTMDLEGRIGVQPIKGLNFGAGFYSGKRGKDLESKAAVNTASRLNALAAYTNDLFKVGVEYFQAKNWNSVDKTLTKDEKADGLSAYGMINVTPEVSLFARYDDAKPDKDNSPNLENKYFNGGVQYKFNKSMTAALVYKDEKVETGLAATDVKNKEIGVFALYNF